MAANGPNFSQTLLSSGQQGPRESVLMLNGGGGTGSLLGTGVSLPCDARLALGAGSVILLLVTLSWPGAPEAQPKRGLEQMECEWFPQLVVHMPPTSLDVLMRLVGGLPCFQQFSSPVSYIRSSGTLPDPNTARVSRRAVVKCPTLNTVRVQARGSIFLNK